LATLTYAAERAIERDLEVLIEPITHTAIDGYHLRTVTEADAPSPNTVLTTTNGETRS
jgi:hydroxypyruvate isomerase